MIKGRKIAAWVLAVAIAVVPAAGLAQERESPKPAIPKEIKELLPKIQENEKKKHEGGDQILPEPIMDEQQAPITKEIPS